MLDGLPEGGIYLIRNRLNGKVYVGSAVNLLKRRTEHFRQLRGGYHFNRHLQAAFNRDGEAAFLFTIAEFCPNNETLIAREQIAIDSYRAADRRCGYNSRPMAHSNLGRKCSPEQIEKIRLATTGKKQSAEAIRKKSDAMRGRKLSPEVCAKIRQSKLGRPRPDIRKWASIAFRKFSDAEVREIRNLYESGQTLRSIAAKYDCGHTTIRCAVMGARPSYAGGGLPMRARGGKR